MIYEHCNLSAAVPWVLAIVQAAASSEPSSVGAAVSDASESCHSDSDTDAAVEGSADEVTKSPRAAAGELRLVGADDATVLSDPHVLCTEGRVSEGSRRAAMACGISAAAAGSGAVPDLPFGAAAVAGSAAAAAVAQRAAGHKKGRAGSTGLQLAQAAAHAAASAAVKAVQQAEASQQCKALPPYRDITNVVHLWQLYEGSSSGSLGWQAQEAMGKTWRKGERKRWCELLKVIREVERLAKGKKIQAERAAAIMDAERGDSSMANYIKNVLPEKLAAREALQSVAAPAADVQATTAAAAAASRAAAAAAAAAEAADAAAHRAAAAVSSRRH